MLGTEESTTQSRGVILYTVMFKVWIFGSIHAGGHALQSQDTLVFWM